MTPTPLSLRAHDRILVVAPHPDDDVLGCGAVLAGAAALGLAVRVVYVTDGTRSHPGSRRFGAHALRALREAEALRGLAACGLDPRCATFVRAPDGAGDALADGADGRVARAFDGLVATAAPTLVFAPWRRDPHPDHRAVARLARSGRRARDVRLLEYAIWLDERGRGREHPRPGEARALAFAFDAALAARKRAAIAAHRSQTTTLVDDAPGAFRLPAAMIARACTSPERFFEACDG